MKMISNTALNSSAEMPSGSRSPKNRNQDSHRRHSNRSNSSSSSRSSPSRRSRSHRRSSSRDRGGRSYPPYQRREPEKIPPSTKLFVTNIDSKFTGEELNEELRSIFEPFGTIKDIVVKTKTGSSNSYCFIQFMTIEAATKAQEELKGKDFKGKELKVEFGRGERKTEDRKSDKCYICHKEGHFAKDCRYNRYTGSAYNGREGQSRGDRERRDDRDRRDRDYRDRDYDRDRDYRRDRDRKHRRHSPSSSSSRDYRRRPDREDQRRRDRYSPQKRSSNYHSSRKY